MTEFSSRQFPTLFRKRHVTTGLADAIREIHSDIDAVCGEYDRLREVAPSRSARNRCYFVGHDGRPRAKNPGNPSEKHLAIALWRLKEDWPRAGGGRMRLLDYEVPLRASRSDAGLGEVDLLGATDQGRLVVVELKAGRKDGSRGDPPLLALMEGLRYAAVIHANHRAVSAEASDRFAIAVRNEPPIVQILATEDWWSGWCDMSRRTRRAAGLWEPAFFELSARLEARLGILVDCRALRGTSLADVTWDAHGPLLGNAPVVRPVHLEAVPALQPKRRQEPDGAMTDYAHYESGVLENLWDWADRHHASELDGAGRSRRPPVLRREAASNSVLVPSDPATASAVVSAVPKGERHRWFRSFKSSQALAQSVFGAIVSFERHDLLEGVIAECGRPAFLEDAHSASLILEHNVRSLGEPRPTSVDVFLETRSRRVAVECKFMEREFGACSRPRLRPRDSNYAEQHCDGNYRRQRGRRERCALTEIGIRYWTYLPHLFDWATDHDQRPCPFSETYQLARNALAATVTAEGFDQNAGHVLIIYDARNPEYAPGGGAQRQYEAAMGACRVPGLVRRLSWQRLVSALTEAPEFAYLVAGLEGKYGIGAE